MAPVSVGTECRDIAHLWHEARTNTRYFLEYNLLFGVDVGMGDSLYDWLPHLD